MAEYVTTKCPNCGYVFEFMKSKGSIPDLGIPYRICPTCKQILIKRDQKEIIQRPNYENEYFFKMSLSAFIISFFIPIFIYFMAGETSSSLIFGVPIGIVCFVFLKSKAKTNFEKEVRSSLTRLKNKEYIHTLLQLNLLKKNEVLQFKNKYSTEYSEIETEELRMFVYGIDKNDTIKKTDVGVKKENYANESAVVNEVKGENNMENNMIGINEIKKIMKSNKKGPLYEFEHTLLRKLFFDKTKEFVDFVLKDKGNIFELYSKLCKKLNVKSKRSKEDFLYSIYTSSKGSIVFCLNFPVPSKIPLCRSIYMEVNCNCEALNYYTVEKSIGDNEFILCSWDSKERHINYGISKNYEKVIGELKVIEKEVNSFDELLVSINDEKIRGISQESGSVTETQIEDCKVVEKEEKISEPLVKEETHLDNSDKDNNKEKIVKSSDSTIKYCRRCGNKIIPGSRFCNNCGLKI